ncbi:ABC transporter substrate-binding protein [Metabacillus malikii]|uniref:Aldouronate transport system substrate-binding protein n=1 Tax=Metabacillus malikii TaxID=1504265 RepID=A0ABT9ZDR3_9BACI|nr:ABC transporter substrate-binding protein [Metabacillus malikii]MDQ0229956.1 putative aldouronate transport system substrate-binding protein [Metabacillus malikii]
MHKVKINISVLLLALIFTNTGCQNNVFIGSSDSETSEHEDVVTFTFFNGFTPGKDINTSETKIGKMFEDETGINFDIEHIVGDVNIKVGTMIASGQYPDLMNAQESTDAMIDAGAYIPLNDLIEEHAPNIKKLYGPYLDLMKRDDGNIYVIPSGADHGYAAPPNVLQGAFWIQRRVLKDMGYPNPKTLDEYFAIIEEYYNKIKLINGNETIGFTALTYDWRFFAFSNAPMHLAGYPNDGEIYVDMETHEAKVYADKEITKKWLRKINEINNIGLFDRESFTQTYDEYLAKIASGQVLGFFDYYWQVQPAMEKLKNGDDPYKEYMAFPIVFDANIKDQYMDPSSFVASPGLGITVSTTDEERIKIIKFLDHMAKEETQKLINWGIEGETFEIGENGRYYRTKEQMALTSDQNFRDEFGFTYFEWIWPRGEGVYEDGNSWEPRNQPEVAILDYDKTDNEFLKAYHLTVFTDLFSEPEDRPWYPAWDTPIQQGSPAQMYEQQAEALLKSSFPKIALAKPEDFEKEWEAYIKEFKTLDSQQYENIITESVKRKVKLREEAN